MKESNVCSYNADVECKPVCRNCWKCGWNPTVRENRIQQVIQAKILNRNE